MIDTDKRHALKGAIARLCADLHGPGHPAFCKGCRELTNPKPWWSPFQSAKHWIESRFDTRSHS